MGDSDKVIEPLKDLTKIDRKKLESMIWMVQLKVASVFI